MDRSKRTAVVVGVAVVLAAVASLGMYRIVSRMPAAQAAEMKTVGVIARVVRPHHCGRARGVGRSRAISVKTSRPLRRVALLPAPACHR